MKICKIVAAVDQTPAGVHALRTGAILADAAGADLIALRIVGDPWSSVRPDEVERLREHKGRAPADIAETCCVTELRQLIADTIGAARAEPVVHFGNPGIELARWAGLEGADLLILGRQPMGLCERRPAGRTIAGTLQQSSVPCLIVPFGQRTWRSVVAVIEADAPTPAVLDAARAFAALWGEQPATVQIEPAGERRSLVAATHGGAPMMEEGPVFFTDPVGETLKVAREDLADVLVVGYPRGEEVTAALGLARRLLERAPCAVLMVPQ